jgi:pyruvate kinase
MMKQSSDSLAMYDVREQESSLSPAALRHKPRSQRHTRIVATIGPASSSPDVIRELILAGMDVARLNFSHGSYEAHAHTISHLRTLSDELERPVTILQDLQGPKVRVGRLPGDELTIHAGELVALVPESEFSGQPAAIPIDYPHAASEAAPGMPVLMADGIFELEVESIRGNSLYARVLQGGVLGSRKGVNFPAMDLRLPSLTDKDELDLKFGLDQGVDVVSLSFVRSAHDVRSLKKRIEGRGMRIPVIAKIEKPQAVAHLEEILSESQGVMVARGDLGVEMSVEKVPMAQKYIIEQCNRRRVPVITATEVLNSMIHESRPTRAEASDVANAIIDGTDAVMLSGESAVGAWPVKAVETIARIAAEVEAAVDFRTYPPKDEEEQQALSKAAAALAQCIHPKCIVVLSDAGQPSVNIAAERLRCPVVALVREAGICHALNLVWGIRPIQIEKSPVGAEEIAAFAESILLQRGLAAAGDTILLLAGIPEAHSSPINSIRVHVIGSLARGH